MQTPSGGNQPTDRHTNKNHVVCLCAFVFTSAWVAHTCVARLSLHHRHVANDRLRGASSESDEQRQHRTPDATNVHLTPATLRTDEQTR